MAIKIAKDGKVYVEFSEGLIKGWKPADSVQEVAVYADSQEEPPTEEQNPKWFGAHVQKELLGNVLALIKHFNDFEIIVSLYYSPTDSKWFAGIPEQTGSAAHVKYTEDKTEIPAGYHFQGTIHSHPKMGAFWSGTDMDDQKDKTGLHMVVGTNSSGDMTTHVCTLFHFGYPYDAEYAFDIPGSIPEEPPKEWIDKIEEMRSRPVEQNNKHIGYTYTGVQPTGAYFQSTQYKPGDAKTFCRYWGSYSNPYAASYRGCCADDYESYYGYGVDSYAGSFDGNNKTNKARITEAEDMPYTDYRELYAALISSYGPLVVEHLMLYDFANYFEIDDIPDKVYEVIDDAMYSEFGDDQAVNDKVNMRIALFASLMELHAPELLPEMDKVFKTFGTYASEAAEDLADDADIASCEKETEEASDKIDTADNTEEKGNND